MEEAKLSASVMRSVELEPEFRTERLMSQGSGTLSVKGVDMYRTKVHRKKAEQYIQSLKNKIEGMHRKENRTLFLLEKAALQEELFRKSKERKLEEEKLKQSWKSEKQKQHEELQTKLKKEREEAQRRKREVALSLLRDRRDFASNAKQTQILNDQQFHEESESDRLNKTRRRQEIRRLEETFSDKRQKQEALLLDHLQETYTQLLDSHRSQHQIKLDEIKRLKEAAAQAEAQCKRTEATLKVRLRSHS